MKKFYALASLCLIVSVTYSQVNINTPWTWMSGEKHSPMRPVIGAKNVASPTNNPGGRKEAVSWYDASGNTWMFGGYGFGGNDLGYLNDLWKYDNTAKQWTWVAGNDAINVTGVYGTLGVAAVNNTPGSRRGSVSWLGSDGKLYLFGGWGYSASGGAGRLNDLWKFDPVTSQWTWLGGGNSINVVGNYGTKGAASATNWPGGRNNATAWRDNSNVVWLFGGQGYANDATLGRLSDMWKYDPATGQWTWMNGGDIVNGGSVDGGPTPRSTGNTSWKDNAGNLYLFGGVTGTGTPPCGGCSFTVNSDLFKFTPSTNTWTSINPTGSSPEARMNAMIWSDNSGTIWLFGGFGRKKRNASSSPSNYYLNDLWKYNSATNQWTQFRGDQYGEYVLGIYGTAGVSAATNNRGNRAGGITWIDNAGKLCSFGGDFQEFAPVSYRNDMWTYDQATNFYTWEKGDTVLTVTSFFTTEGVADAANRPGERFGSGGWSDNNGNLWLFGGDIQSLGDGPGYAVLNDLWSYNITSGLWTCVKSSGGLSYGTQGVPSPANKPYPRDVPATWTDASNNLWMFGGRIGIDGAFNDLWKFDPSIGQWAWMHGTNGPNGPTSNGNYGTKGVTAATNLPPSRKASGVWQDNSGNAWIYGGSHNTPSTVWGDLWKYDPTINQWTWMSGDNTTSQAASYGVLGVASASNKPGGRGFVSSWKDATGNLWMFGGINGTSHFSDVWKYDIASNQWTWINGGNTANNAGVYGTRGVASASNKPGARYGSFSWTDANGNFWLLGGHGIDGAGNSGELNDLWMYNPTTNEWVWAKGSAVINTRGVYGTKGVPSVSNEPGARHTGVAYKDGVGDFWIYGGLGIAETGTDRLSDLWRISSNQLAALPVHFVEFKGNLVNNNGVLSWKTENEENALSYIIERSTDRRNYVAIGTVAAKNTSGMHQYSFSDPNITALGAPVVYYRLKQKDFDGKFIYTNIVALTIDRSFLVFFYPNPVLQAANVTITTDKPSTIQVKVINAAGAVVKQLQWKLNSGSISKTLDLGVLAKGSYYLDLSGETVSQRIKFVKQ